MRPRRDRLCGKQRLAAVNDPARCLDRVVDRFVRGADGDRGNGHHQSAAAARDAAKKEALRRAGIGYHEVVAGQTLPSELRRLVEKLVERPPENVE